MKGFIPHIVQIMYFGGVASLVISRGNFDYSAIFSFITSLVLLIQPIQIPCRKEKTQPQHLSDLAWTPNSITGCTCEILMPPMATNGNLDARHTFFSPSKPIVILDESADIPSPSSPARHRSSPGSVRPSVKRKPKVESEEQASRTPVSPPPGRGKYINIGACQDELDPSVVEKLSSAVALAAISVHKYWTSSFGKAVDTAEVAELIKLAKMYTSRSHVLNCELYKKSGDEG
ncbi:Uncharacterized protein Fot_55429 [Forsythia ovata]|uniref:Uncharacterized protein n=1 Tax=Forsythia ovata TaxID=205694 RepID=A0ABD1P4R4_9LAMI